jgi:Predicted membrane protein (DUF2306)
MSCVAIAVFAPLPYFTQNLQEMAQADAGLAAYYLQQPLFIQRVLLGHAGFSALALLLAPLQASAAVRRRLPRLHRWSGRVSFVSILLGASGALVLAPVSYAGLIGTFGFGLMAIGWSTSATLSVRAAMQRRFADHRRWSIRTMAFTFSAVTLRLWTTSLILAQRPDGQAAFETAFDRAYQFVPFLSWVPNVLIVEYFLRRSTRR